MKNRLLILLLAAVTFLALLGRKDIVTSHEARVAQTARIMAASGRPGSVQPVSVPIMRMVEIDGIKQLLPEQGKGEMQVNPWLVPVINHQLRLQKPPLPYWCEAIVFRLAGFGEWQARLVPALLGALATLLVWDLASLLLGRRAGWIAAGVWLSTHFIVDEFRKSMADPYLTFCTLMCVWAWVRVSSCSLRACSRSNREQARGLNTCLILVFYVSLALGALAKGPVIFITVFVALIALHLCRRRRVGSWWAHLIGIAIFASIVIPWPVYIIRHVPNAMDIWRYESVGEMTGENVEKARPWWMYIGNSFQLPLPWTPLWMGGFAVAFVHRWRGVKGRRGRRRMVAILWQVLTVVFFSLSSVKKPAYLLPTMAAQTLVTTDALMILLAFGRRGARGGSPKLSSLLSLAQALIGIGFAAGLTVVMIRSQINRSVAIVAGAIAIVAALSALHPVARKRLNSWLTMQVVAYAVILIVLLGLQRPAEENRRSSRQFAAAMAQYLHEAKLPLLVRVLPEDLAIYLPLDLPDADDSPYALLAIDHSPKDPPETPESLSQIMRDAQVIEARRVPINAPDGNGRWRLFEVTLKRPGHQDLAHSDARDTRTGKEYIESRLQGWESKNGARSISWLDIPRFQLPSNRIRRFCEVTE